MRIVPQIVDNTAATPIASQKPGIFFWIVFHGSWGIDICYWYCSVVGFGGATAEFAVAKIFAAINGLCGSTIGDNNSKKLNEKEVIITWSGIC